MLGGSSLSLDTIQTSAMDISKSTDPADLAKVLAAGPTGNGKWTDWTNTTDGANEKGIIMSLLILAIALVI